MTTNFKSGYALVIGIGDYEHLSTLPKAPIDAQELAQVLVQQCGYPQDHVALLLNAEATKPAINNKLQWLAEQTTEDNTVILFFSGHGARSIHPAAPGEYLCPVETTFEDIQGKAISSTEFSDALSKINARKVVVFFDACHSGGIGEIRDATRHLRLGLSEQHYECLAKGEGRVIIASCKANEVSWELDDMNNGLFTHYLLEGLRGKAAGAAGDIKITRLFGYTSDEMAAHIKAINEIRPNSIAQTPWINAKTEDFVVAIVPPPIVTVDPVEEDDTMSGIPNDLLRRLRETLAKVPSFQSHSALCALFTDARIALWANNVPETNDRQERVNQTIAFLHKRENTRNENGLVLFLQVLAESLDREDKLRLELEALAKELAPERDVDPPPPPDWSRFADSLLEMLKQIPALDDFDDRSSLLTDLPPGPSGFIKRSTAKNADLRNIVNGAKGMGRLTTGEYALVIVARNALEFVVGAEIGERLQTLIDGVR